jgi:hypothetical protein
MAKDTIFEYAKNNIPLDVLETIDTESQNGAFGDNPTKTYKKSDQVGDIFPFIKIGKFSFGFNQIEELEIECFDFLPRIRVTIKDTNGVFASAHFPKDKPILNVYIKSKSKKFKPIRNDYLINKVIKTGSSKFADENEDGIGGTYVLTGVLLVPGLYESVSQSYENMSSYEVLFAVAKECGLGFASNDDSTSDRMNWINTWDKRIDFIKDVTHSSYKDDDSFFITFIDVYYNLNFINLHEMLGTEPASLELAPVLSGMHDYLQNDQTDDTLEEIGKTVFSNFGLFRGSEQYIEDRDLISNQGDLLFNIGDSTGLVYYDALLQEDDPKDNNIILDVASSFNSVNIENKDIQTGKTYFWGGIDYGNDHDNYLFSKANNAFNLIELRKINLAIKTENANFSIIKGSKIPVVIVTHGDKDETTTAPYENHEKSSEYDDDKEKFKDIAKFRYDDYLTDNYVIIGIKYVFDLRRAKDKRTQYYTEMILARNNWGKSPEIPEQ